MRKCVPKGEQTIRLGEMRDNMTYMNSLPIQIETDQDIPVTSAAERYMNSSFVSPQQMADSIKKMVLQKQKPNKNTMKYFKAISSKPIISNMPQNFKEQNYDMDQNDLVQVCSSKVFQIKNYYNYLYQEEIDKVHKKVMERNRQIQIMAKATKINRQDDEEKPYQQPTFRNQEQAILDPAHIKYQDKIQTFNPKEKQRMELSSGPKQSFYHRGAYAGGLGRGFGGGFQKQNNRGGNYAYKQSDYSKVQNYQTNNLGNGSHNYRGDYGNYRYDSSGEDY